MCRVKQLGKLVGSPNRVVTLRDGVWQSVAAEDLVPGDVVKFEESCVFPCDAVIIYGSALVMEEPLTGESASVMKVKQHIIFHVKFSSYRVGMKADKKCRRLKINFWIYGIER